MKRDEHTPICPKCGYDQRGEIATWESVCPVEGRCPECGLAFSWADVLDPGRVELGWYVEHAKTPWEMVKRTIPTLWMLLIPNRYWRRLGMEAPRSLTRYSLWVLAMMCLLHLVSSLAMIGAVHGYTVNTNASYMSWMAGASPARQALIKSSVVDTTTFDYWWPLVGESVLFPAINRTGMLEGLSLSAGGFAFVCCGISVMWFILFCMFPVTRSRMKLRLVHIARAMVVVGLLPFLFFEIARVLEAMVVMGEYWKPMKSMSTIIAPAIVIGGGIWLMVWIQWFWISAVWIGWKVKARWYEMVLVTIASFLGFVLGGGAIALATLVSKGIDALALWAGI